jgi:preprotein translocase subunit Sec61beta
MASDNKIQMPAGFGGLMRYDEEYDTRFKLKPVYVIGFVILIIAFRLALSLFLK